MEAAFATLLLADRDQQFRLEMCEHLEQDGFLVRQVGDGNRLMALFLSESSHAIVLDLTVGPVDGLELCRLIRRHSDVPIVVVTTIDEETIKLEALKRYVDDYIVKGTPLAEISARISCVLRRTWLALQPSSTPVQVDERLCLDFSRRQVRTPQGVVRLTPMESRLLQVLVRNAGQVLPTEFLLERLWGDGCQPANSLWEYIRRIRHKIGDDAARPRYIVSEPRLGYRFKRAVRGPSPELLVGRSA